MSGNQNTKENKIFQSAMDGAFELCDEFVDSEEIKIIGNSFFDRSYFGTRILILAPHCGDEIAVAGNTILNFTAAKAEIFIAYSAEKNSSEENIAALKILNVPREKIIFLHKKNFDRDLKNLILELRANIIFCVDFDSDFEHRILSLTFEKIIGEILTERADYRPEVYKKFAFATALDSPPDFYAPNLFSTRRPKIGVTDNYDFEFIDRANYLWNSRVRFPVPEACRKTLLKNNPLASAISCYRSRINKSILRILNSDEIFFERRTDSVAYLAKISASSGEASKARDFKIIDTKDAKKIPAQVENNFWRPDFDDEKKILAFDWEEAVQVRRIVIHGNILDDAPAKINIRLETDNFRAAIDKRGISLDNVYEIKTSLPNCGCPLILDVEKIFVRRAEISVVECGKNFGIAEVEFFSNAEPLRKIQPFVKLTVGKDFFYRFDVPYEVEKISVGLYRFHVDEPVKICAESEGENILTEVFAEDEELVLNFGDAKEIILTAEVIGNPNIYDRAIIRRVNDLEQIRLKIWQWLDKLRTGRIR